MTIRGGGNPHSAMAAMPLREWTRRLGALPAEAYDCFMVGTPYGFNRIQAWFARLLANHACIRLNPYGVPTMKQSYASAGKAPRRRVHSLSGIAAIAECGLPPPRIVIGYPAHQVQSGAEPWLSFLLLECFSRRRPQLATLP